MIRIRCVERIIVIFLLFIVLFFIAKHRIVKILGISKINEESIFVYRAYLDKRGDAKKLRVLTFNGCHQESIVKVKKNDKWLPMRPIPMYTSCPEEFAFGCSMVAYFHEIEVEDSFSADDITIKGFDETKMVPLHVAEPAKQLGISICMAPMFWYTDWAKLIFFFEFWKKQQVEQIFVYVHSASAHVKKVLDYYEKKGTIVVISWPTLPSSWFFQPNNEIFRLGQILAVNDCILRTKTEFATTVDIDEMMYSVEKPLTEYVLENFANKSIGSLSFLHHEAVFEPPLLPKPFSFAEVDFRGINSVVYRRNPFRRSKIIVRTNSVVRMAVHDVMQFRNSEVNVTAKDAYLFHIRYDIRFLPGEHKPQMNIISDPQWFQLHLLKLKNIIFPEGASYNLETVLLLGQCTDSWRETQNNCMAPGTYCRDAVIDKEEWIEEKENVFTVI